MKALITIIGTLAALYALWLFHLTVQDRAIAPILETQLDQYILAADTAAIIAYETDPEIRSEAMAKFVLIKNGPMQVIGEDRVNWAMALFESCMKDPSEDKCKERDLQTLSGTLSKTMRASIAQSSRMKVSNTN